MKTLISRPCRIPVGLNRLAKAVLQRLLLFGTLSVSPLPAAESSNYALAFDGTDDRVQAGPDAAGTCGGRSSLASMWAAVAIAQVNSFSFTVPTGGCISITNNFYSGNNTLEELIPAVNSGLVVYKWSAAQQAFLPYQYIPGLGWEPAGGTLSPGEGAFINNPNTFPLTFTFTGNILAPPARTRPAAGFYLVGCPRPLDCGP